MPDQLTQYEFDRDADRLGSGAFGDIYRAWDKVLKRNVALKISKPTAPGDDRYSIPNEVLKIMDYRHENLVNYFYAFETEGTDDIGKKIRRQVAVMEFVEGKDLHKIIMDGDLGKDPEKIEEISIGILKGIHFLHNHRIIHRDLKPSNIMIVQKEGHYISKITDFGISKEFDANSYVSLSGVVGTFSYMAPEQFGHRNREGGNDLSRSRIDLRLDIWAFGVILYELFLGFPPFGNERTHTTAEIIDNILQTNIPEDILLVPEPWRSVIRRCLQREPNKRYKNVEELLAAITGKEEDLCWGKAITTDTKESYEKYVAAYPVGRYVAEAKKKIETLITKEKREKRKKEEESLWEACLQKNEISDFRDYLNQYPDGDHTDDAGIKIELLQKKKTEEERAKADRDFWEKCKVYDTIASYKEYLATFKNGKFTKEATEKILFLEDRQKTVLIEANNDKNRDITDEAEWLKIKDLGHKAHYEDYLNKFPEGRYRLEAIELIAKIEDEEKQKFFDEGRFDQLSWDYLENRITLAIGQKYLTDYPQGIHVTEIRHIIKKANHRRKWYWAISIIAFLIILTQLFIRFIPLEKSYPDKILYNTIRNSENPDDFVSFMQKYPKSIYSVPVSLKIYEICEHLMWQGDNLIQRSDKLDAVSFEKTQSLLSALVYFEKAHKINEFSIYPSTVHINENIKNCIRVLNIIQEDISTSINYSRQEYGEDWNATEYLKILSTIQGDSLYMKWRNL